MARAIEECSPAVPVRWIVVILACAALIVSGCASNPYIGNTRPGYSAVGATAGGAGRSPAEAPGSIEYGLRYADNTYEAYETKLAEEFTRQQRLSGGLLTLGAMMLGMAVGNANQYWLGGTALVGGLAYQLGTWNSNQGRLGIYLEGMKALSCAKSAIAPLRIDSAQIARIGVRSGAVSEAVKQAANAAGEVTRWLSVVGAKSQGNTSRLESSAESDLAEMANVFNQANDNLGRAAGLKHKVQGAGALLEGKVDEIRRAIDGAINGTLADLANLPKVIGGISDYANIFAPGLNLGSALTNRVAAAKGAIAKSGDTVTAQAGSPGDGSRVVTVDPVVQLATALGQLRATRLILAASISELNGALETMTLEQIKASLSGCNVDAAKIASPLRLDRTTVTFRPGVAGTSLVTLSGGTTPYSASILDLPPPKGIHVSAPATGAVVVITAGADTVAGQSMRVNLADATGVSALLTIKVEDASSGASPASSNKTAPSPKAEAPKCFGQQDKSQEEICLVQQLTGAPVDGDFGTTSCTAFLASPLTKRFAGLLNNEAMKAVKQAAALSESADASAIRAKLAEKGVKRCGNATLPPAPAVAASPAGSLASSRQCEVADSRGDFECEQSKKQVRDLRIQLGLNPTPEEFDDALRKALAHFQVNAKLAETKGNYTKETAAALQAQAAAAPTN